MLKLVTNSELTISIFVSDEWAIEASSGDKSDDADVVVDIIHDGVDHGVQGGIVGGVWWKVLGFVLV